MGRFLRIGCSQMPMFKAETLAEKALLDGAALGAEADCSSIASPADKSVRASFLRALMLGQICEGESNARVPCIGAARLSGAIINEALDLSHLGSQGAPLPGLILKDCDLQRLDLTGARIGEVELRHCRLTSIAARRAHIDGHLNLNETSFQAAAAIDLDDIAINHCLIIENCSVDAAATGQIGAINLHNASIGGDLLITELHCSGAAASDFALHARDVKIAGEVTILECRFSGGASFFGARIGVNFLAHKSTFLGRADGDSKIVGEAFLGQNMDVGGSLIFVEVVAQGETRLLGAAVGGHLYLGGAELVAGASGVALNIHLMTLRTTLFIYNEPQWGVVGGKPKMIADKPTKILGRLDAYGASAPGGVIINRETDGDCPALIAEGPLDFRSLRAGLFTMTEASICAGSAKSPDEGSYVLSLLHAEIAGPLKIRLDGSSDRLHANTGQIASEGVIDLRGATVGTLDSKGNNGWGSDGVALKLDGFTYDRIEFDHSRRGKPPSWIRRLFPDLSETESSLIAANLDFLSRAARDPKTNRVRFFPQPYRELASTLREMGHGYATRPILYEMERKSLAYAPRNFVSRVLWNLYGITFGFGYSSFSALRTLIAIFFVAWVGVWIAEKPDFSLSIPVAQTIALPDKQDLPPERQRFSCAFVQTGGGPVAYECVDGEQTPPRSDGWRAGLRKIFAEEKGPYDWAPPCETAAWLYAIDLMLPIVDFGIASSCDFPDDAWGWHIFKLLVALSGAIAVPLAALTFAGLLQRQ